MSKELLSILSTAGVKVRFAIKGQAMRLLLLAIAVALSLRAEAYTLPHDAEPAKSMAGSHAPEGYSVGNFGMAAAIDHSGLKILKSLLNPPVLGEWLEPFGSGELRLSVHGKRDFVLAARHSVFPENSSELVSSSTGITAHVETFAPISDSSQGRTCFNNFIPAIIVQVVLSNAGQETQSVGLSYLLSPDIPGPHEESETFRFNGSEIHEVHRNVGNAQLWLMAVPDAKGVASANDIHSDARTHMNAVMSVGVEPRTSILISFVFGVYDSRGYTSGRLTSRRTLELYLLTQGLQGQSTGLARQHADFVAALPRTGDSQLDAYLRWYLSAAILLTKGTANGDVLTMGYAELNQRDSFWTTGVHLIYWPDLELKMLRESMHYQDPNGQIPMTILPVIRRTNNVDGNEYFILRIARYYEWYRDDAFLREALPHVKRAIAYLVSLDRENIGLPKQMSIWADWKDVPGVEGRTYAPHFDLLWLATLKKAQFLAQTLSDTQFAANLAALYAKACERINRDVAQGGLWDNNRYIDLWGNRRTTPYTLEDQTVGAIYGVIPRQRLESIYAVLNRENESAFGVRETYPYITTPFLQETYGPGQYHNGGIWPWLNFADAWGRFLNGHGADAERILKKVGHNDLVRLHDFVPSEFLNGETGDNEGYSPQGWDADFFSAIYFGAFGLTRVSANQLDLHVNLGGSNNFTTTIRIPEGELVLRRTRGRLKITPRLRRQIDINVMR